MKILAIETSFDETAAAVVEDGTKIVTNVIASSKEMHEKYGGVVPEIAARQQLQSMIPVLTEALSGSGLEKRKGQTPLDTIDAIAVTIGPGLIGSLLVGVETAKTIAMTTGKPIIPVNHVLAHMYANFVDNNKVEFPAISLVVSGAHTELYLMKSMKDLQWLGGTIDDAAGECFDKTARLLGFGYGGGMAIEKTASKHGNVKISLPRPLMDESFNFSFSGLKTAVMREWKKHVHTSDVKEVRTSEVVRRAFAYEIQESITDVLVKKTLRAAKKFNTKSILLSGGVAANQRLREKFPLPIHAPLPALCTDNAVIIASYAYFRGEKSTWRDITATPDLSVEIN